jgi:dipeptidase E
MTFILNGGGDAQATAPIDSLLADELPRRTMLYVPHAVAPSPWSFDRALEWLRGHEALDGIEITMWTELQGHGYSELDDFDAIYLMGGNTFVLLAALRSSGFDALLDKFAASKRVICGVSAGAIVLGQNIATASLGDEADENTVGLTDLSGLKLLGDYQVHTHYTDEDRPGMTQYVRDSGPATKVICIPEDAGVIVSDYRREVVGGSSIVIYTADEQEAVSPGSTLPPDLATSSDSSTAA